MTNARFPLTSNVDEENFIKYKMKCLKGVKKFLITENYNMVKTI